MKKVLFYLIIVSVIFSFSLSGYTFYNYKKELDKIEKINKKSVSLKLEDHYFISPNDIILTQYSLKTWLFAFDNTYSYDGIYNKDWLPLNYNYCQVIKWNAFEMDNDFDKDWVPNVYDKFPYDYSNWDYDQRNSNSLDFDKDWITNINDKDADWNWIMDIYQTLCMNKFENGADKQFYSERLKNVLSNKQTIIESISNEVSNFLTINKLEVDLSEEEYIKLMRKYRIIIINLNLWVI